MREDDFLPGKEDVKATDDNILIKIRGSFVTLSIAESLELAGILVASVQAKINGS